MCLPTTLPAPHHDHTMTTPSAIKPPKPLQVAILVFDEVEALDLGGPYEVFTTAVRMAQRLQPGAPAPFAVQCVGRSLAPLRARARPPALPGPGPATTRWEDIADLRAQFPTLDVRENVRWVDRGALVTSAGISAGIDMSLHLVTRLAGAALREPHARVDVVRGGRCHRAGAAA